MKKKVTILLLTIGLNAFSQTNKIKVYFNNPVNNSTSNLVDAININDFTDTIIAYINRTQNTLDVCNYNTSSLPIVTAINNAKNRGVTVRYIASNTALGNNNELASLNTNIPLIQRPNDGEVMHNKFMIFDVGNANKATIMSGSANHSTKSLATDFNNLIFIQDQALAQAYKTEFEEMWGSNTNTPTPANAKFGNQKTDNTPHNFVVDGVNIELYFSPSDNTEGHIESALLSANTDVYFEMLTFTSNALGDAIVNRLNNGVTVKGIIHNTSYWGSEFNSIVNAGGDVISTQTNLQQITHNKYAIVDAGNINSDPILITGSHNWSNSAQNDYDENTLIIHDKYIAHHYLEAFGARRPISTNIINHKKQNSFIYPNPAIDFITIKDKNKIIKITITDFSGKIIKELNTTNNTINLRVNDLAKGNYLLILNFENQQTQQHIITIQ